MPCRLHALLIVAILVAFFAATTACFDADKEPPEEDVPADDDAGGDDDAAGDNDESDDDASDDDTSDDDTTDDDDDDSADDDTTPVVSCDDIANAVYDTCTDAFSRKSDSARLEKTEANDACEDGDPFWTCVQGCLDADADCAALAECVNGDCAGPWEYDVVP
ncbi:MAG: hypothetical protein KJ042_09665 [Deltaproteobacteria bacterium]|nr:hypothetical protein [Deltaproteobacteria bacterium]